MRCLQPWDQRHGGAQAPPASSPPGCPQVSGRARFGAPTPGWHGRGRCGREEGPRAVVWADSDKAKPARPPSPGCLADGGHPGGIWLKKKKEKCMCVCLHKI